MLTSEFAPLAFAAVAVCGGGGGGSSTDDLRTPSGFTCADVQLMLDVELDAGSECRSDTDCDQIIEGTGVCPTDDVVLHWAYDADHVFWLLDQGDMTGCDLTFDTAGHCPDDAEPACVFGTCRWE